MIEFPGGATPLDPDELAAYSHPLHSLHFRGVPLHYLHFPLHFFSLKQRTRIADKLEI